MLEVIKKKIKAASDPDPIVTYGSWSTDLQTACVCWQNLVSSVVASIFGCTCFNDRDIQILPEILGRSAGIRA